MTYIINGAANLCCACGPSDKIEVTETVVMIDCETGEQLNQFYSGLVSGRLYRCEKRWAITQAYNVLDTFKSVEEANKCFRELVKKLGSEAGNSVIEI